jgi:hypothetical protein
VTAARNDAFADKLKHANPLVDGDKYRIPLSNSHQE